MKCLYIKNIPFNDDFIGGARAHIVGMINGFVDSGAEILVLTDNILSDIRAKQIVLYKYKPSKNYDREVLRKTLKFLKQGNYGFDCIYCRFSPYSLSPVKVSKKLKIPLITEFNSSTATTWKEVSLPRLKKSKNIVKRLAAVLFAPMYCYRLYKRENRILNAAKLIVTVSTVLKEEIVKRGISGNKILVCPNGVDPNVFYYKEKEGKIIRENLGIDEEKVLVGFSGTFGKWHGIPEMTEAIEKIERKNIYFLLIGYGMMHSYIYEKLKNKDNVIFIEKVSFNLMPNYLSACDILLITNSWNPKDKRKFFGSPTKLFEYMATERAIIASDLEQIGDIMADKDNCVLFSPSNVEQLIDAIELLADDALLRKKLGMKARYDVVKSYTWSNNGEKIIDYFERIK